MADFIIHHIQTIYTSNQKPPVRGKNMNEVLEISDAFVAIQDGFIVDFGNHDYHQHLNEHTALLDASGLIMVPGLIDSHTHLVHGGSREEEFTMKINGVPYLEIYRSGGGILNTVEKTRTASFQELYLQASDSLDEMLRFGVTTVEAKSGYGLNLETEIKQLEVAKKLNQNHWIDVISTYLGAHAFPKEYREHPGDYVQNVIASLRVIKNRDLADFVDVFCEQGVFDIEATRTILEEANRLGFKTRLHADEMASIGATALGIALNSVSVDHLLAISDADILRLANTNTIANLLPSTAFYLDKPLAPARKLIDANGAVAISSDYNPGSSPSENFQFSMQLAGNKMKMTPKEILVAATINPAYILGVSDKKGSIEIGKEADLVLMKAKNLDYLIYHFGINHALHVIKKGIPVVKNRQIMNRRLQENGID